MYESPVLKRMRAATQDAVDDAEFVERLIEAIDSEPEVRAAILRVAAGAQRRQDRPTTTQPVRRGRGR